MSKEIWKDVKNYEGLYKVSNHGKIKSLKRKIPLLIRGKYPAFLPFKEKILRACVNSSGYRAVCLRNRGTSRSATVHRLVLQAFQSNPENKPQGNHKDGNILNNNINNLEWCTQSENMLHAHKIGLYDFKGNKAHNRKLNEHQVRRIRLMREITPKLSDIKIGKMFKVTAANIYRITRRKTWQYI